MPGWGLFPSRDDTKVLAVKVHWMHLNVHTRYTGSTLVQVDVQPPGSLQGQYWGVTSHPIVSCERTNIRPGATINWKPTAIFVGPSLLGI